MPNNFQSRPDLTGKPRTKKIEFTPHEGQERMLMSKARFIAAMGGKRGGKTTGGCYWAYREWMAAGPDTQHLIGAPTYDQLNASVLTKLFLELPPLRRYYKKKDRVLELPNGITVFCRSLDQPEHVEGLNLSSEWIDEADGLNKATWDILQSRTGTTLGRILLTSSVYPNSWMYEEMRTNPELWETLTWESKDNPAFPVEEWERLRRTMPPEQFAREYQSEFVFGQGSILGGMLRYGVVDRMPEGVVVVKTWIGLDFGWGDPTAIVVVQLCSNGCYYIVDEHYQTKMNVPDIDFWLGHFFNLYSALGQKPSYTFFDTAGAIPAHSLKPHFNLMPADKGMGSIRRGINLMTSLIQQEKLCIFSRCVNAVREIREWSWEARGDGSTPEDRNNHTIDAFRYAIDGSWDMVQGLTLTPSAHQDLSPYWERRKDDGVLRNGVLVSTMEEEQEYGEFDAYPEYF